MEPPRRKIIAKVEPSTVSYSTSSRSLSRAASPINNQSLTPDDSPSPSPSPVVRPKAKITPVAASGTLKPPSKSGGLAGKKAPVSSVNRPASMISTRTPFGRPASPIPPSRRAPSPQLRMARVLSPEPPVGRNVISSGTRIGRLVKSPSPPLAKSTSAQPTASKRTLSPVVPAGRRAISPTRPTKPGPSTSTRPKFNSQPSRTPAHRRAASASASSSVVSGGGEPPSTPPNEHARTRLKLPASMSSITLTCPPIFSSFPQTPSQTPSRLDHSDPSPLSGIDHQSQLVDSPELTDMSAPSSAAPRESSPAQPSTRNTSSAPATPAYFQPRAGPTNLAPAARPRNSSVTIVPGEDDDAELQTNGAPAIHNDNAITTKDNHTGIRIKAKLTATTPPNNSTTRTAHVRPQQLAAPPRHRSGSISATSSLSGLATSTLSRTSSVRVTAASRILSPPPDRSLPGLSLLLPGSMASVPPSMRSPPVSSISSASSASQTSTSSQADSSAPATSIDRARTPMDSAIRTKITATVTRLGFTGGLSPPDEEGPERDDSGIDMFEADDADPEQDQREEARSNRKIADLEISNKSLLSINASLESTKTRQAKEIRDLRRKLRESRLVLPPSAYNALEQTDPLETSHQDEEEEGEDSDDNDVTQLQADETYARVRNILDQLLTSAKEALEAKPPPLPEINENTKKTIRVLDVDEVKQYVSKQNDDTTESKATDSVAGDLAGSIDDDATSVSISIDKTEDGEPVTTPKHQSTSFGLGIFGNWGQR